MQPLIDGDVLVYEAGFACQTGWEGDDPPPFDYALDQLENKLAHIMYSVEDQTGEHVVSPIIYLTGKTNFRNDIAKTTPYKERLGNKPFHYNNLKVYLKGKYDCRTTEGLEADDLMSIEQFRRERQIRQEIERSKAIHGNEGRLQAIEEKKLSTETTQRTIICTRDKDLRQVSGWHFGWELGNQPAFRAKYVGDYGHIEVKKGKLIGWGDKFFFGQCITGDMVDSIPGLKGKGPVYAFETLKDTTTYNEGLKALKEAYKASVGDSFEEYLLEQGQLLFMVRKLRADGSPILWNTNERL